MERYLIIILFLLIVFFTKDFFQVPEVLGVSTQNQQVLPAYLPLKTLSKFDTKLEEETTIISKKTTYQNDPETEAGEEKVLDEGEDGKKVTIYKITYYQGEEYDREVASTEITEPKDKKILRGTKIVWKSLDTPDGTISYWKKMRVYASSYDGGAGCSGCSGRGFTALGLRAGKGVIAVDPAVIKLGSQVYVPGYGKAVAGDTGGAIKGNIIDLGFDNAATSGWSARFTDIYILN